MHLQYRISALACAVLLSACGGGASVGIALGDDDADIDDFAHHPLRASSRAARVTVTSTDARFDGTYASNDVRGTDVLRFFRTGSDPETCRFRFAGLAQESSEHVMDGEIRYLPGSNDVRTTIVWINNIEFRLNGTAGATVDRANRQVAYDRATLANTQGLGSTVTLTGAIPMRAQTFPEGC